MLPNPSKCIYLFPIRLRDFSCDECVFFACVVVGAVVAGSRSRLDEVFFVVNISITEDKDVEELRSQSNTNNAERVLLGDNTHALSVGARGQW